ncbi:MAG: peptidoglycan-binding domain-containing protein [Cyanobacteria bacterium P01_G01_bin.54]
MRFPQPKAFGADKLLETVVLIRAKEIIVDALAYTHSYANHEDWTGIEYEFEAEFFDWLHSPSSAWLQLLAVGVLATGIMAATPAQAIEVDTPSGRCLNARLGPGTNTLVHSCVNDGMPLLPVVKTQGNWLQLSSGRWVYGPYTTYNKPPAMAAIGGPVRQVSTPKGSCLNARLGPSTKNPVYTCVRNGAPLKTVVNTQGDWLQLSSGRWVYGPYTKSMQTVATAAPQQGTGGRLMLLGAQGDKVKGVQKKLTELKYDVGKTGVDGIYGSKTREAVIAFQKANDLTIDGIVGPETLKKMGLS